MKKEELLNGEYQIEHADARPLFIDIPAYAFAGIRFAKDIPAYRYVCTYYSGAELDWMSLKSDIREIGEAILSLHRRDPSYFLRLYQEWKEKFKKLQDVFYSTHEESFSLLSDDALIAKLRAYETLCKKEIPFPAFLDSFAYTEKEFHRLLAAYKQTFGTHEEMTELFSTLAAPVDESFLTEAENELRDIARAKKEDGEDVEERIEEHRKKFSYIQSGYAGHREYSTQYIGARIVELMSEGDFSKVCIAQENREKKAALLAAQAFPPDIVQLMSLTELFIKWQDDRKMFTLMHVVMDASFSKEVAQRAPISPELLTYASFPELITGFEKGFDQAKLQARTHEPFLWVYENGGVALEVTGPFGKALVEKNREKVDRGAAEIRGVAASLGKARGRVRIIRNVQDSEKLIEGEILVIAMTRPEHTPAMKRAAAIVTDDGGIICHAAIVARELKKPCMVGTKVATQVLHDGDLVEVDADKGVVRIVGEEAH